MAAVSGTTITVGQRSEGPAPSQQRPDGQRASRGRGRGRGRGNFASQGPSDARSRRREGADGRHGMGAPKGPSSSDGKQNNNAVNAPGSQTVFALSSTSNAQLNQAFTAAEQAQGAPGEHLGETGTETNAETDAEVCFICASTVVHNSVAPCNHRTCHICALRMRALYKTKDCAHCRTEAPYVIFTDDPTKRYEEYTELDIVSTDENIGIKYQKAEIAEDTILLLRYNCPDPNCDVACLGWADLHRHVRSIHHKKMCDLCTRYKKVFTHEHDLFIDKELERHMKKGDDNPGAIDQSGFKGHPLCGFCGERFYGDDELYAHCRSKHERCFICDRRDGRQPQYYLNYNSLELHFRKDHFLCPDKECLEKKFIVFATEIDLKAHQLKEHGNTLPKDVRRDARIVDMSTFDYRAPYAPERSGGGNLRDGRGRGRGRDPNTDPIPTSSAQPLRRDEQALQRQMAIQNAQSVPARTFGGQPTSTPTSIARVSATRDPPSLALSNPSTQVDSAASQLSGMDLYDNSSGADIITQERAGRLRHASVIERATTLLQNDQPKLTRFRNFISSYRANKISASALIESLFSLFSDTSSNALGSLIRDVADLYEDKAKSEALHSAWNDWRAINEDYPSLPGPSGTRGTSLPLGWAQVISSAPPPASAPTKGSSRVLKLKSSTVQSSRSASWGSASSSSAGGFPELPVPSANPHRTAGPAPRLSVGATQWLPSSAPVPGGSVSTSRPAPRPPLRPAAVFGVPGSDAFPALPPAAKPTTTIFGYGTGAVRRDVGGASNSGGFSWGRAATGGEATTGDALTEGESQVVGAKKKGNKGKKEVLVKWG